MLDRSVTRLWKLPPRTNGYLLSHDVPIPMRDGIDLLADIYSPNGLSKGTVLVRSPYGYSPLMAVTDAGVLASRGYRVVLVRCRGTHGSGGSLQPMQCEVDDATDTVAWLREQPWFEGRFATYGGSYCAFTQWALMMEPPPELTTAVCLVGPHDFQAAMYEGGAFNVGTYLAWSAGNVDPQASSLKRILSTVAGIVHAHKAARVVPLAEGGRRVLRGKAPWYDEWINRRDRDDPFWSPMQCGPALDRIQVPVMLVAGWHDIFLRQSCEQYERLRGRGIDVGLTVGPWTHFGMMSTGGGTVLRRCLEWLDQHLAGGPPVSTSPVRVYMTGAEQWRDLPTWPAAVAEYVLYPQPNGTLSETAAFAGSQAHFTYDPADPTPVRGGRLLVGGGPKNDGSLAKRGDVVSFTSRPLAGPLLVCGTPVVELAHETENGHGDLFVRLSQVDRKGRSRGVADGFVRLESTSVDRPVRVDLDPVAHRFAAGTRLRLLIAGGALPRFERNLGTGQNPATGTAMARSQRAIDLQSSRIVVPTAGFEG
jgi:uncharacterized protein